MSGNPLIIVDSLALGVSILICVLAAYRAFASRRVLVTPLYRSRALWTGTVALMLILGDLIGIFLENTNSSVTFGIVPPPGTLEFYVFVILTASFSAVAFGWIDSTIRIALELDFLHRGVLKWRSLGPVAGATLVVGIVVAQFSTLDWQITVSFVLLAAPVAYMAAALVVGRSRVRDRTIRTYMRWMGVLVLCLLLQVGTSLVSPYLNFPLALGAYSLYQISSSLLKKVPLSLAVSGTPGAAETPGQGQARAPR